MRKRFYTSRAAKVTTSLSLSAGTKRQVDYAMPIRRSWLIRLLHISQSAQTVSAAPTSPDPLSFRLTEYVSPHLTQLKSGRSTSDNRD
jgi:hypothetical protein